MAMFKMVDVNFFNHFPKLGNRPVVFENFPLQRFHDQVIEAFQWHGPVIFKVILKVLTGA